MKVVALNCNQCGAALQVGLKAQFATCAFCQAQLRIHHTDNAHFTEVLEAIAAQTQQLSVEVAQLKAAKNREALVRQLSQIDKAWAKERQEFMNFDKHGKGSIPTLGESIASGIISTAFGAFWMFMTADAAFGQYVPFIGAAIIVGGLILSVSQVQKAKQFERARRDYLQRRQAFLAQAQ